MKSLFTVLGLFLALGFGANVATAALIVDEPIADTNGSIGAASSSGSFSVPKFDDMGGIRVLDSVQLTVNGHSYSGSIIVENLGSGTGAVDGTQLSIGSNITVTGPSSLVVITIPTEQATGQLGAYDGVFDASGTDTVSLTGTSSLDIQSSSVAPPTDLSPYIGPGTVNFTYNSLLAYSVSSDVGPTVTNQSNPTFMFNGKVTYMFHVVPEPATISLLLLSGLGLLRRRM